MYRARQHGRQRRWLFSGGFMALVIGLMLLLVPSAFATPPGSAAGNPSGIQTIGDGTAIVSWFAAGYVDGSGLQPKADAYNTLPNKFGADDVNWPQTLLTTDLPQCGGIIQTDTYEYGNKNQKKIVNDLVEHGTLNKPGSKDYTDSAVILNWQFTVLPKCPEPPVDTPFIETSFTVTCDAVTITLHNHSAWIYPVSYSTDGSTPDASGPHYGPVVDNRTDGGLSGPIKDATGSKAIAFVDDQPIKFVVAAGSENSLYVGLPVGTVTTVVRDEDCDTETTTSAPPSTTSSVVTTSSTTSTTSGTTTTAPETSTTAPKTTSAVVVPSTSSHAPKTTSAVVVITHPSTPGTTITEDTNGLAYTGVNTKQILGLGALLLAAGLSLLVWSRRREGFRQH